MQTIREMTDEYNRITGRKIKHFTNRKVAEKKLNDVKEYVIKYKTDDFDSSIFKDPVGAKISDNGDREYSDCSWIEGYFYIRNPKYGERIVFSQESADGQVFEVNFRIDKDQKLVRIFDKNRSESIRLSWRDPDIRHKRLTRNRVYVNGKKYPSVNKAFIQLGLNYSKRIKIRMQLKEKGEIDYEGMHWKLVRKEVI